MKENPVAVLLTLALLLAEAGRSDAEDACKPEKPNNDHEAGRSGFRGLRRRHPRSHFFEPEGLKQIVVSPPHHLAYLFIIERMRYEEFIVYNCKLQVVIQL